MQPASGTALPQKTMPDPVETPSADGSKTSVLSESALLPPAEGGAERAVIVQQLARALPATLIGLLMVGLYADVVPSMVSVWWNDPGYSHGLLIPPLAAYIAWRRRSGLLALPSRPDARGLMVIGLACGLLVAGRMGAEFFLTRVSLVFLIGGLVWTFWGAQRLRKLAFPLFLLLTMVPLPAILYNQLATPLQLFASSAATALLQLLLIPVYQDGNIIHMTHTRLGIAEACSGLRSISSLTVLALMMGYLQCPRLGVRAALALLALPTAVAVNVGRIVATALVAEHDTRLAEGFYHLFSGWLVFVVGLAALGVLAKGLNLIFARRPLDAGGSQA